MTVKEYIVGARRQLEAAGVPDASIESELLLRQALGVSTVELYLLLNDDISPAYSQAADDLITRRLTGEPSAFILGKAGFYDLEFYVRPAVLIPRPETELLVEKAIWLSDSFRHPIIADIGAGSGAVAVTLAKHLPHAKILAIDISPLALEIARLNATRYDLAERIVFLQGDLLAPLKEPVDIILANLPYVKSGELPNRFEPVVALDGGPDGLRVIERFCGGLSGKIRPGGSVLVEVGQGQAGEVTHMVRQALPEADIGIELDLAGIERVVRATLPLRPISDICN